MQVARWGNSLAIRIPAAVVRALELKEGDDVVIDVAGAHRMELAREASDDELLDKVRALRGRLPRDFRFDREEANGR